MFYPPPQFEQFQLEQQQRKEFELLYKQQQHLQSLLLSTPPPSPMSATLGHPNRSCASCKKRKVKCDRKTPSCTACQKSKHKCHYTSYSPPVFTEDSQHNDDGIKVIKQKIEELDNATRQRWEQFQKLMAMQKDGQGYANNPSGPYYADDELVYINNPVIPTSTGSQYSLQQQQGSPQQYQIAQQQQQQQYLYPQQPQYQPNSAQTSPYIQTNVIVNPSGNYSPYMSGTIVLNYNLNGMRSFLGRQIVPILQTMTGGQGPTIPSTGFSDVNQLQDWLRERFLSQDWIEEMETYSVVDPDERFELRPIYEDVNQQSQFTVRQKFEVILHRAEFASSPSSVHGDFQAYNDYEDKHNMDMENLTVYSETGSNRSSVADLDPSDAFLNKIYDFVRRFIRNLPWLRENFLANWRTGSNVPFSDGVFSDVVVEVRKIPSYSPYQDLKLIQANPQEDLIKGRLTFF